MRAVKIFMAFTIFATVMGAIRIWHMDPYVVSIPMLIGVGVINCLIWFAVAMLVYWIWRKVKGLDRPEKQWDGQDPGLTDRPVPDSWTGSRLATGVTAPVLPT